MTNRNSENYNPFANVFRIAFEHDILRSAIKAPTIEVSYPPRVHQFMRHLNRFLQNNGETATDYQHYAFDEHKLFEYALFLRGYMRDAQKVLANLKQEHTSAEDLIELFHASSEYVVACNHQLKDKRIFDNNVGYHTWQINLSHGLKNATYLPQPSAPQNNSNALYLFMPFRVEPQERILGKWLYTNMRNTLDNPPFLTKQVNVYAVHYPLQKSRCSNITSVLKTIQHSPDYFEAQDMDFVRQNWLSYVATDVKIDDRNKVENARPHSPQQLQENFGRINIFSYCAGTANAHRCLIALQHITLQIYGDDLTRKAIQNVFVCSYGFLPTQEHLPYSGVHFYSHLTDDANRREPFANLNNHTLYEQTKCQEPYSPARFSVMPDGRNIVVALRLADRFTVIKDETVVSFQDGEFGHSMTNINTPNILDTQNFSHHLFKSVLQNSCLGKRGADVLNITTSNMPYNQIQKAVLWANRQNLRR